MHYQYSATPCFSQDSRTRSSFPMKKTRLILSQWKGSTIHELTGLSQVTVTAVVMRSSRVELLRKRVVQTSSGKGADRTSFSVSVITPPRSMNRKFSFRASRHHRPRVSDSARPCLWLSHCRTVLVESDYVGYGRPRLAVTRAGPPADPLRSEGWDWDRLWSSD